MPPATTKKADLLVLLGTASPMLSLLVVWVWGTLIKWDGQGATIALPFAIYGWMGIPVWLVISTVWRRHSKSKLSLAVFLLSIIQFTALIVILIDFSRR